MTARDDAGGGRAVRVATLDAQPGQLEQGTRRVLLKAGVELVLSLRSGDERRFGERAQALRDARPDVVFIPVADRSGADELVLLAEPLRFGCVAQRPLPRVLLASGDDGATARATALLSPFAVDVLPDVRADAGRARGVARLRELRGGEGILRDDALEELAVRAAQTRGSAVLVVDVTGSSTSLVRADAAGVLLAAHARPLGTGSAADRVVARAGLDRVRRWIPWAVDQPTLLERVFNRARWPGAVSSDRDSLAVEIALAHEAIAHAVADAAAAGIGAAIRSAAAVLLTGRLSEVSAAQASLIVADALDLTGPASIALDGGAVLVGMASDALAAGAHAELDAAIAERLAPSAAIVPVPASRRTVVRLATAGVHRDERVERGAFYTLSVEGDVEVSGGGVAEARVAAGPEGLIIDARPRPLALPIRDAERVPAVARWYEALGATPGTVAPVREAAAT